MRDWKEIRTLFLFLPLAFLPLFERSNMGQVYRKQRIEGVTVPAIIKNGQYFWHNMAVYEDGVVSCWDKVDLSDVPQKLASGKISVRVPDGKGISVFHCCYLNIESAKWNFDAKSYYEFIRETVKKLNPEMANIYKTTDREKAKWNKHRVGFTADPTPFKLTGGMGYRMLDGNKMNIFLRENGKITLTVLSCYEDGTFSVDGLGEEYLTIEDIERLFAEKTLCAAPESGETVTFGVLGAAKVTTDSDLAVSDKDKLEEIRNDSLLAQNKPDALELAREAYFAYLVDPCDFYRERLREAYEAVPEHQRCYLGDMDTRDTDYVRILYTDEKREV